MWQIECAGRLVVFAWTALGRLLRAHEGLGRRAWAIHCVVAGLQWGWRGGQLEVVSIAVFHDGLLGYWAMGQEGAVDGQQRIAVGDRQASAKKQKASNVGAGNRRLWFYNATLYTPS